VPINTSKQSKDHYKLKDKNSTNNHNKYGLERKYFNKVKQSKAHRKKLAVPSRQLKEVN